MLISNFAEEFVWLLKETMTVISFGIQMSALLMIAVLIYQNICHFFGLQKIDTNMFSMILEETIEIILEPFSRKIGAQNPGPQATQSLLLVCLGILVIITMSLLQVFSMSLLAVAHLHLGLQISIESFKFIIVATIVISGLVMLSGRDLISWKVLYQ